MNVADEYKRALMFKFRAGIAPLRIETGRSEASSYSQKGIPTNERICLCCCNGVEDELHFLSACSSYEKERVELIDKCKAFNSLLNLKQDDTRYINSEDKTMFFTQIMQSQSPTINNIVADFIWKAFHKRELRLEELGLCR